MSALAAGLLLGVAVLVLLPSRRKPITAGRALHDVGPGVAAAHRSGTAAGARPAATGPALPAALVADLVAALLLAGLPPAHALAMVDRCLDDLGLPAPDGLAPVLEALRLAEATGLAPAALVREAAAQLRRSRAVARSAAARRLAVLVVLPMGLALLPAFFLLTVAPFVLGLLSTLTR